QSHISHTCSSCCSDVCPHSTACWQIHSPIAGCIAQACSHSAYRPCHPNTALKSQSTLPSHRCLRYPSCRSQSTSSHPPLATQIHSSNIQSHNSHTCSSCCSDVCPHNTAW